MTTLKQRLEGALEYNLENYNPDAERHARLQAILAALIECVEALDMCDTYFRNLDVTTAKHFSTEATCDEALANLEKVIGGEG